MIPCICIDDKNKPRQIPAKKWVKEEAEYRITGIYICAMQGNMQGVTLAEIKLDETCAPYEVFRMSRFAIRAEDFPALVQLAKDCSDIQKLKDQEVEELLKEEFELIEQ